MSENAGGTVSRRGIRRVSRAKVRFDDTSDYVEADIIIETDEAKPTARRPPDNRTTDPFAQIFPPQVQKLVTEHKLTGNDFIVLFHLIGQMGFDAPFTPKIKSIADAMGIQASGVSRSMRHLRDAGVVIDRPNREILLDPDQIWKGKSTLRIQWLHRLHHERTTS